MPGFGKSRFIVTIPLNNSNNPEERLCAIFHTLTRSFIVLSEKGWASVETDPQPDAAAVEALLKQGFLFKDGVDETTTFWNWRMQYVHDFGIMMSKMLVTRQCNNGCRYCIVNAEAKSLSGETARKIDTFYLNLIKENNPKKVEDNYSGGEVMLNPQVLLESATRRFYYCMGKGVDYGFSIISNGTLLKPEFISRLKEVGLSGIRVSMAGPARIHDHLRPLKNGGKTYELIMGNLQAISGMTPIGIETQYDSSSLDYQAAPEMIDDFKARGIEIQNFFFTPILARRNETEYTEGLGDPKVFVHLMKEAERRGFPQFKDVPTNACLADYRARMVFDTDGSIIPCGSLNSGEFVFGNAATGIDFVAESQIRERRFPDKCMKECAILPLCMGGCRITPLAAGDTFNAVDCQYEAVRLVLDEYLLRRATRNLAGKGISIGSHPAQ